jgi:hypothetical protein
MDSNESKKGGEMKYIAVFNAKQGISEDDLQREWDAWIKEELDELFHKGCVEFERFETYGDMPRKIFFVIDTGDRALVDCLSRHFDTSWMPELYPVHVAHPHPGDHAVIGG